MSKPLRKEPHITKNGKIIGRPKVINEDNLTKLEMGFLLGLGVSQACLFAEIVPATYFDYVKVHPEYKERQELLQSQVSVHAKIALAKAIAGGDLEASMWYLERKESDEFGKNTKGSGEAGIEIIIRGSEVAAWAK